MTHLHLVSEHAETARATTLASDMVQQVCAGCGGSMGVRAGRLAACARCGALSCGARCVGCGAEARMQIGQAAPVRWVRLTVGAQTAHGCSVGCAVLALDGLSTCTGLPVGPVPAAGATT